MVVPNMIMKFHSFDIFYQNCYIFDLSSALVCRVESSKIEINREVDDNWHSDCMIIMIITVNICDSDRKVK